MSTASGLSLTLEIGRSMVHAGHRSSTKMALMIGFFGLANEGTGE